MIKADQIPDEVLEAMARPVTYPSGASVKYINALHLAAALAAWPGMSVAPIPRLRPYKEAETLQHIILPLQETPDAK